MHRRALFTAAMVAAASPALPAAPAPRTLGPVRRFAQMKIGLDTTEIHQMIRAEADRLMERFAGYAAERAIAGIDLHDAAIGYEDGAGI